MSDNRHFTDEELVSFLDGECSGELATEISLTLERDKELQTRLAGLDLDLDSLREGFDQLLEHAPKADMASEQQAHQEPIQQDNRTRPFAMRPYMQIAALLLAGLIGYSASLLQPSTIEQPQKPGWIDMVVSYQQLYSQKTLALASPDPEKTRTALAQISKELGRDINFEQATSRSDMTLKQTQLLSFRGKPLVQLAYLSKAGTPLALCIIKSKKPGDAPPKYQIRANMQLAVWRKGGYAYLLIGGQDRQLVKTLAEDFSVRL